MKVVLDTNVVVSAFLSPIGNPATILQLALRRDIEICFNTAILSEYEQVLCRAKSADRIYKSAIERFFEIIYCIGRNTIATPSNIDMTDESDRIFFDVAKSAEALLITGNKKHYPSEPFILDPAEFLKRLNTKRPA